MALASPLLRYRGFVLDIDGVLLRGRTPLPGAAAALAALRQLGPVVLLTNNSTKSRRGAASRLRELGLPVEAEELVPSSYVAARYLREEHGPVRFWYLGEEGIAEEMALAGHGPVPPEEADWLVVGMDRGLTYAKLAQALGALLRGARLLATNRDPTYPTEDGLVPGGGAVVGALEGMGFPPEVVVGKPSPIAFRAALAALGVRPEEALMIGDRLETDIAGAQGVGMDTAFVLTGISTLADVERTGIRPTWVATDLVALVGGEVLRRG
ncbi:MAG: HAD-IIA family hydrolase [Candidatus Bipolaricaulota bacterium]|nr:HAD-IIA family hydrolase [Candidatus Bipolaricaulota bacterium]